MKSNTLDAEVPSRPRSEANGTDDRKHRSRLISDMIDDMRGMEDGWFEGRGLAPDGPGLLWLNQQFQHYYIGTDSPLPRLFPIETGGVYGEWSLERHVCGIEIDLLDGSGSWFDVDRETHDGIDERVLDLNSVDGWQWLINRLTKFTANNQP